MQPIIEDDSGTMRFKANRIVRYLLDAGPFDMNHLAQISRLFTAEEHMQFAQLIGYGVNGYQELSYVSDDSAKDVEEALDELKATGPSV